MVRDGTVFKGLLLSFIVLFYALKLYLQGFFISVKTEIKIFFFFSHKKGGLFSSPCASRRWSLILNSSYLEMCSKKRGAGSCKFHGRVLVLVLPGTREEVTGVTDLMCSSFVPVDREAETFVARSQSHMHFHYGHYAASALEVGKHSDLPQWQIFIAAS